MNTKKPPSPTARNNDHPPSPAEVTRVLGPAPAHDPCRDLYYQVEDAWGAGEYGWEPEVTHFWDDVKMDQVVPFMLFALDKTGWETDEVPRVVFDLTRDDEVVGVVSGVDRCIHLNPELLSPQLVLHELAHWLDGRDGHGPRFQATFIDFIDRLYGGEASAALFCGLMEEGLEPDVWGLPSRWFFHAPGPRRRAEQAAPYVAWLKALDDPDTW